MIGRIHEECTYCITVQEHIDEDSFNAEGPHRINVLKSDSVLSRFTVRTDQSGLIGVIRQLHRDGYLLISLTREP